MRHTVFGERAILDCVQVSGNPDASEHLAYALRSLGILSERETLLAYEELQDFARASGGSYDAVFRLEYADRRGAAGRKTIRAKAIVTGFGEEGTAIAVRAQVERLRLLSAWGIRTPRVYGSGKGTIYLEHVEGILPDPVRHAKELARIAVILEARRAQVIGFPNGLVDRGGELFWLDVGSDLGHLPESRP
jgi:hypothetical protein